MFLMRPTQMCWICGKAVTPETSKTDEHGSSVHARCYAARVALAAASQDSGQTARMKRNSQTLRLPVQRDNNSLSSMFMKTGTD
jgi:hypothetical protein